MLLISRNSGRWHLFIWVILCYLYSQSCYSQEVNRLNVGNSLGINIPAGEFKDEFSTGISFTMNLDYSLATKTSVVGEFGWTNWFKQTSSASNSGDLSDAWSILAGLRYNVFGMWYLETRTGFYFKTPGRWVLLPATGARINRIDLNLAYSVLENSRFASFRIGYFWGD